jgi:hypothetical protein
MGRSFAAVAIALLLPACAASTSSPEETPAAVAPAPAPAPVPVPVPETVIEWAARLPKPPPGVLATGPYLFGERERPHFDRLDPKEHETGTLFSDYAITGKTGTAVGWFGIVRAVREDAEKGITRLLVEHKYFDGLQDTHILCTSFNGGGDFVATLGGTGHEIPLLAMVKVYGTVASEKDGVPRLPAAYVRVFNWGTFTFMRDYGKQKGNEAWRSRCTVDMDDMYAPFPGNSYYESRLGSREEFEKAAHPIPE